MANPFENIRTQAGDQNRSFNWYMSAVKKLGGQINSFSAASKTDLGELTTDIEPGSMYLYVYDAKYANTLPYYDRLPLCLPFDDIQGGFAGMNLHYLPPLLRAKLLGNLLDYTDKKLTEKSKIEVSWSMLKGFSKFPEAKPTVKKYLYSNVKSRFLKIAPEHWKSSIFLPLQTFNVSVNNVWKDSRENI